MEQLNYTVIHCHTDFSNGVTNIDSVTKYNEYIDKAVECGMKAIAITEHGNVFEYFKKHAYCKEKGIKYIHGAEVYLTKNIDDKIRDNYHCCLYAKNYKGFLEINKLISGSFNRKDGHYYYAPRILIEDLYNTSDNIIIGTACIGGIFKSNDLKLKKEFTNFLSDNKHRCFLEIQHHQVKEQIEHNKLMRDISEIFNIPLIVGTDTHALNDEHAEGRVVLQESKNIRFPNEEGWDITWKTYDEVFKLIKSQNIFTENEILLALENTNNLANMVEEFEFDTSHKYPKLFKDSFKVFLSKIREGIEFRGVNKLPNYCEYQKRIIDEIDVYKKVNAIDYMLLQTKILEDGKESGVEPGFGRGSCNGSIIAYLLGITEMDSVKYNLNFFRFLNPSRVTNADIDVDFSEKDREWIKNYIFNMEGIKAADIITFNTIALKGAIRDVGRAFKTYKKGIYYIAQDKIDEICSNIDFKEEEYRLEYPELFKFVDIIKGTIVSIGSHPSGVLVSDLDIEETIGLCSLAGNNNPVTQLSMKPLDALFYVKLDVLGLDSIGIINETCKLAGIPRITPDTVDIYDDKVWKSIREDTTAIFQMESDMAHKYFKDITRPEIIEKIKVNIPNIRMFDLFMFICGAIRPAGENFRDSAVNGLIKDNGFKELNDFLHDTLGYLLLQEQIMQFLVKFCGYSEAESDNVRRLVAKKGDTSIVLEEIERRFLDYTPKTYNVEEALAKEIIKPFLLDIKSASGYGFSANHNNPYSLTGYIQGYLRYYHTLEFLTTCLNTWSTKEEKMIKVTEYAEKKNIKINPPKFRYSKAKYHPNKETNSIYKGIGSIKYCNEKIGDELYSLRENTYKSFLDLLIDINNKTSLNSRQLDILIKLGFFSEFGGSKMLLEIVGIYNKIATKKQFKKDKLEELGLTEEIVKTYAKKETEKQFTQVDTIGLVEYMASKLEDKDISIKEIFETEMEYVGYISYKDSSYNKKVCVISNIEENRWGTIFVTLYCLKTGKSLTLKVDKRYYNSKPLEKYDVVMIGEIVQKFKKKKVEGKWINTEEKEYILKSYGKVIEDE